MNKDVVYIDTEDDITAIIGKVKASKERIVALVPPKRIGVLQSAVNLRLLVKMAEKSNKRLVLVTNNKALINLSSVARIPVAKSLQSKPEMAEIDALEIDEGEDIIEGEQLPIGELMKTADEFVEIKSMPLNKESVTDAIDGIDIENDKPNIGVEQKIGEFNKTRIKVPDFTRFRKILFASILGIICLIGFLVWAIGFAPAADVIITTKTSTKLVKVDGAKLGAATDIATNTVKVITKETKQDLSVTFEATGVKNIGESAAGIIIFSNCDTSDPVVILAGTTVSLGGKNYITQSDTTVGSGKFSSGHCSIPGASPEVAVTAEASGAAYNTGANAIFLVKGYGDNITASSSGGVTGGTDKVAKVVTADDISKAAESLKKLSTESARQKLINLFVDGESVISESYIVKYGDFISTPAVDTEVTNKATLKSSTTFSVSAVAKADMEALLNDKLSKEVTAGTTKVYDNGIKDVTISGYLSNEQGVTIDILTKTAKVGPNIDEAKVKELVKGKKFGDAQLLLTAISDVSDVKINFSYFWVTSLPNDINKIDVQFILQDA